LSKTALPSLRIWLPALDRFDPRHSLRPLLGRGDRLDEGARGYLAGLEQYFRCGVRGLPAAALTRELLAGDAGQDVWLSADPSWVQPDMNGARLLATGQLGLDLETAQQLAQPLKPVFGDSGMLLEVTAPDRWHLRLPAGSPLPSFAAPEQALGEDLFQHLPQGPEGRRWRVLLNEVQVLLHQHPLNAERRGHGQPPVNSLWLWGGGALPLQVNSHLAGVIGDDVLLIALAAKAGIPRTARTVEAVAAASPGWLVDLQDLPASDIEQGYGSTLAGLAARQPLQLDFASGERWLCKPWHRWRWWRRGGGR
jgi:hypothetical protein